MLNTEQNTKNSKPKTNTIVVLVIIAIAVVGIIVYFTQNRQEDISKYYGTYECQVYQGEARTTYRITLNEGVNVGKAGEYLSGTYSATSTNVSFSFSYNTTYSIKDGKITIKFNQGQTISGTFDNGTLIINAIGEQRNLVFTKVQ